MGRKDGRAGDVARARQRPPESAPHTTNGVGELPPGAGRDWVPPIERRRSGVHGWGVFATARIPKNKRIIHYAGERISSAQSLEREGRYLERGHIWCFRLNRNWARDAARGGNIARFINHACRPNCYSEVAGQVIWIRASRTIEPGEELTYNYYTEGDAEIPCQCRPGCRNSL